VHAALMHGELPTDAIIARTVDAVMAMIETPPR